jgi:sortase A
VMVFHGVEASTLVAGAGQVPGTPRPGANGNVVVVAHRDTHFRRLNGIREGDRVFVVTSRQTYAYVVHSTEIVDGGDTHVLESRGREELTLITCYPFAFIGAASDRFLVHSLPIEHSSPVQKETSAGEAGRYDR